MHRRVAAASLGAYAVVGVLTPLSQLLGLSWLTTINYVALMPLLVVFVRATVPRGNRTGTLLTAALVLSWLGDWADWLLLMKIGFFFGAQLAYLAAFWPSRRTGLLTRPVLLTGFGVVMGGLTAVMAAHAGSLAVPVTLYGVVISLMTVLATGVNRIVGLGAFLFLVSDVVLAVHLFIGAGVIAQVLNSVTYLPGQLLLAVGLVLSARAESGRPLQRPVCSRR